MSALRLLPVNKLHMLSRWLKTPINRYESPFTNSICILHSKFKHCVAGAVSTHHHLYPGFFFMNLRQSALDAGECVRPSSKAWVFPNSRTAMRENCGNKDCFIGPSFLQSYSSCVNSWIVYSETRQISPPFQIDMPLWFGKAAPQEEDILAKYRKPEVVFSMQLFLIMFV